MRVWVSDASLVGDFCDHLAKRGFAAVTVDEHEADVLIPWEEDEFFAALRLSFEVKRWQTVHAPVAIAVDPVEIGPAADRPALL